MPDEPLLPDELEEGLVEPAVLLLEPEDEGELDPEGMLEELLGMEELELLGELEDELELLEELDELDELEEELELLDELDELGELGELELLEELVVSHPTTTSPARMMHIVLVSARLPEGGVVFFTVSSAPGWTGATPIRCVWVISGQIQEPP